MVEKNLRNAFGVYLAERGRRSERATTAEKEKFFLEFLRWHQGAGRRRHARGRPGE
jgi:hypothetical protein